MPSVTQTIGVRELRAKLSEVLRRLQSGDDYVIVSRGKPIAELKGLNHDRAMFRKPGALAGQVWMDDAFDALPEDLLDAVERDLP